EEPFHVLHAAPRDQRDGSAKTAIETSDEASQRRIDDDQVGAFGMLEQRAVNVEEDTPLGRERRMTFEGPFRSREGRPQPGVVHAAGARLRTRWRLRWCAASRSMRPAQR